MHQTENALKFEQIKNEHYSMYYKELKQEEIDAKEDGTNERRGQLSPF